jgi:hypothetical protein
MPVLIAKHDQWKDDIFPLLVEGRMPGDELWEHALRTLTVALCSCDCIAYQVLAPAPPADSDHQRLLVDYPAIYTALQFARTEYLNVYFSNNNVTTADEFQHWRHPDLAQVISRIADDPAAAANFAVLLALPP